ncbi:MAG: hypothetical protein UR34_C0011G0009 [candidate division WS6 bacterium GW2011_GWC1_33_20]|uniref:Helix-turn-helix domain-containing protein n=1 Tax=candidate division WS6 bacterium GW2011_GWC1_33_20 TaxID=1619089 RepID=A0A0G0BY11_9BACT|nr:MAG: hypothetical protein UR34_C0011G0009 [candidate division WS6 bacterium GW2011_GWC1_33_20]
MEMENQLKIEKKKYKPTDSNLFFQVKIKSIKDDLLLATLSGSELKIIFAISSFINDQNKAYPSQKYLAKLTGLSVSSVSRNVSELSSKKFKGESILQIIRERENGNKFTNNRYYLSPKVGINFGSVKQQVQTQESITHNNQTNYNYTLNKNKLLKNNNEVISFNRNSSKKIPKSSKIHEHFTKEDEEIVLFYAKVISEDKPFDGDLGYAHRVLEKNIEIMGLENWRDLTKTLQNHASPKSLLNHMRFCIAQKGSTYEEAWKEWNSKY